MTVKFIPIQEREPEQFWNEVSQWPTSVEVPESTQDRLLDEWIVLARQLCEREAIRSGKRRRRRA